jgi:hypothetical protein
MSPAERNKVDVFLFYPATRCRCRRGDGGFRFLAKGADGLTFFGSRLGSGDWQPDGELNGRHNGQHVSYTRDGGTWSNTDGRNSLIYLAQAQISTVYEMRL